MPPYNPKSSQNGHYPFNKALQISPLISEKQIQDKIRSLGQELTEKFKTQALKEKRELVAVCVLNGSIFFFADLLRAMEIDLKCDFLSVTSYHGKTKSSGEVKLVMDLNNAIEGKDVLLIEDIIDSGLTLQYLKKMLEARKPASLTIVGLLVKSRVLEEKKIPIDYFGFTTKEFVIGYGMDYENDYRNLPYIASMKEIKERS